MNIRYPIYEGVYRILTMKAEAVRPDKGGYWQVVEKKD